MARIFAAVAAFALLAGSVCAFDDTPAVGSDEVTKLIEQLGDDDYDTREAAEKRLGLIGDDALPALREACKSENPEQSRRATRLTARLSARSENKKNLTPTLVSLDVQEAPLRDVLTALTKQLSADLKYPISLDMDTAGDRASKKITVRLKDVPFWTAMIVVCDAADLRIHSVGGFVASDSRASTTVDPNDVPLAPPLPNQPAQPRFGSGARPASTPATSGAIILAPRNGRLRRPSAVYGAVCIEAIKMPDAAGVPESAAVLLNVWPEPKLNWIETMSVKLERAEDDVGQLLAGNVAAPTGTAPQIVQQGNVVFVKQVNGGVQIVNPNAKVPLPAASLTSFVPSIRQTVLQFKPGKRPSTQLTDLRGALYGTVRSNPEPLFTLNGEPGKSVEGSHAAGVQMKATLSCDAMGKWHANVELNYDRAKVEPASGNSIIHGICIADADGKAFGLSMASNSQSVRGGSSWTTMRTTFNLFSANGATGDPTAIAFLATYPKPVEVPFALAGVPVTGGRK